MYDMDYLKAWNTSIGHMATDNLIKAIGTVMHKYVKEINDGKWINETDQYESLSKAFVFRFVFICFVYLCKDKLYSNI